MQSGLFIISDADCGFTIAGVNYKFEHIDKVVIENPEKSHLTRGANSSSKLGLQFKEGSTSPKTVTFSLKGISPEFFTLLSGVYTANSRLDCWVMDRITGSHKTFKDSILQAEPRQLNISEGEENLNVELMIETFNLIEEFKDAPAAA
jgi:hypothetical protein